MKLDFTVYVLGIVYRPWRLLTLLMALPLGIATLCLWYFSESPKFLANVGRGDDAVKVLKRMYVANGYPEEKFPVSMQLQASIRVTETFKAPGYTSNAMRHYNDCCTLSCSRILNPCPGNFLLQNI